MDVEILSRIQFAFTISFHYIYPPLSIGLGLCMVFMEGLFLKTKDPLYEQMTRFFTRIFALIFGIGVATGIVMEFEFGTSWATYSKYVGDVLALGLVLGNILLVLPLDKNGNFQGDWTYFINPYAGMVAISTLALFMMHGAIYLVMKTEKRRYTKLTILVKNTTIFFVISVLLLSFYTLLYQEHLTARIKENTWIFFIPVLLVLAVANITRCISKQKYRQAFLSSALVISLRLVIVAVELHPNMVVSTLDPAYRW